MNELRLHLDTPSSHIIFVHPGRESYTFPLSGSLRISPSFLNRDSTCSPKASVSLVRTVKTDIQGSACTNTKSRRRYSLPFRHRATSPTTSQESVETVLECQLWPSPAVLAPTSTAAITTSTKWPFCIPIPSNIPATTRTDLGSVSYTITATVTLASGKSAFITRALDIFYRLVPTLDLTTRHVRQFPGSPLLVDVNMTQHQPKAGTASLMFSVALIARNILRPGILEGEMKFITIKTINWWIEEEARLTEIISSDLQSCSSTCKKSTRSLSDGVVKVEWPTRSRQRSDEQSLKPGRLEINFNIMIPRSAEPADDIYLDSYGTGGSGWNYQSQLASRQVITVDHHLKIEISTGEDTWNSRTNTLLDRKILVKSYGTILPMRIHQLADSNETLHGACYQEELPAFEVAQALPPPSYETSLQSTKPFFMA
ncbi:uncharacterized protein BO97DRAFT_450348 [Aspergillus homomorphus CBS 101889]|uniref:LDB19 N-terminal domain-containing protein n=1 Tax=Aspergillus homomorphus (strain CBS 101889) TaxID=1450537 RepID=A0A395I1L0_ASPHC|nr:hypothetical protein BO97DRAFT_450348 [Aspergillus homomorphus CBS 101889]RAL13048.1 hypothetical protein BO97DRAFT_450348 [Aspergillus homomorphus CBS 101889]